MAGVRTFRPDDPDFGRYLAESTARAAAPAAGLPPGNFHPRFGDYISGRLDAPPTEDEMAEQKRATKDEVETLPDGR